MNSLVTAGEIAQFCQRNYGVSFTMMDKVQVNGANAHAVFQWLKAQGGVPAIEQRNIAKARMLYDFLDQSDYYRNEIDPTSRSRMNVPFFLRDESRNEAFLTQARANGLVQLKGHKSVGGMRASIYNAMPLEGVTALVEFMREFERTAA